MMQKTKYIISAILGGLLVLFAIQNMAAVQLSFLFWSFESRRFVVIGLSFGIGLAIGWLLAYRRQRQHGQAARAQSFSQTSPSAPPPPDAQA